MKRFVAFSDSWLDGFCFSFFFFSSRRRHTRSDRDWSSDVCSSDLVQWPQVRAVAGVVRAALDDFGLIGWPKTSGSRGMHVYVRIERRWTFDEVRSEERRVGKECRSRWSPYH